MNIPAWGSVVSQSVSRAVSSLPSVEDLSRSSQLVSSTLIHKFNKEYCPSCQKGKGSNLSISMSMSMSTSMTICMHAHIHNVTDVYMYTSLHILIAIICTRCDSHRT
jgi:hypothetical protein